MKIAQQDIREATNIKIASCRNISEDEAKKRKLVLAHEVLKVLDFFGFEVK